nr:hypothetical protein [Kibdelosporangium sp. MJ126-NF4]CTQ90772.1 hypothetical protein [Kibdelosporangium sp. MJ126-NF4]
MGLEHLTDSRHWSSPIVCPRFSLSIVDSTHHFGGGKVFPRTVHLPMDGQPGFPLPVGLSDVNLSWKTWWPVCW